MLSAAFDSSVLVSAFLSPSGTPAALLVHAEQGRFRLFLSSEIIDETTGVLLRPKHVARRNYTADMVDLFRHGLSSSASIVEQLPPGRFVPLDPKDDMVAATAIAAGAGYLVTGDHRHLLALGTIGAVRIVTPRVPRPALAAPAQAA